MKVAILLLHLFLFLLSGTHSAYAGVHQHSNFSPAPHAHRQTIALTNTGQEQTAIRDRGSNEEREYLAAVDAEDEDTNDLFARKFKWLTRLHLARSYSFSLGFQHNSFRDCEPSSGYFSCKYIVQRTLRI